MPTTLQPPPTAASNRADAARTDEAPVSLSFLFWTFLRAGCLGFGGFLSLISIVENLIVKQRKLLTSEEMLDGITLASLLPGPQAVNVVAYAGYKLRGARGAWIASVAVVLPAFVLMLVLSYFYGQYGKLEFVTRIFHGFVPAVAAVILSVVWRMAKQTVKGAREALLVAIACGVFFVVSLGLFGIPKSFQIYVTLGLVVANGCAGYLLFRESGAPDASRVASRPTLRLAPFATAATLAIVLVVFALVDFDHDPNSNLSLVRTFSGMSVMFFGGGYVFIPMMQQQIVDQFHWLSSKEFVDCIALSQVTPGPLLIAATFIGYRVTGFFGALLATLAIFTPPAVLMVFASRALAFFKKSAATKAVLRGVRCGVIGMIVVASYGVLRSALPPDLADVRALWPSLVIFVAALVAVIRFGVDVVYVVPLAGLLGYCLYP